MGARMGRRRQCADGRKGINHVAGQSRQLVRNPKIIPNGHVRFFFNSASQDRQNYTSKL